MVVQMIEYGEMAMYNIDKEIKSISEYIDFIHNYRKDVKTELWYRGQRDSRWLLDSTLNRDKIIDIPVLGIGEVATLKYKNIPNFKEEMDEFRRRLGDSFPNYYNKFHLMFLGQHYKLKTPALDWSTDPLVALFFALDGFEYDKDVFPVVFILKPGKLNENSMITYKDKSPICEPLIIDELSDSIFDEWLGDPNNTPFSIVPLAVKSNYDISYRISRQSGVFTLMDTRQPLNYPWIQTNICGEPFGIAISIDPTKVEEMKQQLESLNITKETIYGSAHKEWDDICEEIVRNIPRI